jgi:hypothetical protein
MKRGRPPKVTINVPAKRGRKPRDSKTESPGLQRIQKTIVKGIIVYHRSIFSNVPHDLYVDKFTPHGTRVIVAKFPDSFKFYLKAYHEAGEQGFPHGGVTLFNAIEGRNETHALESITRHPTDTKVKDVLATEVNVSGHRSGTKAAEKAAAREERRRLRNEKLQAKQAKRQERLDKKNVKVQARLNKKDARENKKRIKEEKRAKRLAKKELKLKKLSKQKKLADKFFGETEKKPRKSRADKGKKRKKYRRRKRK